VAITASGGPGGVPRLRSMVKGRDHDRWWRGAIRGSVEGSHGRDCRWRGTVTIAQAGEGELCLIIGSQVEGPSDSEAQAPRPEAAAHGPGRPQGRPRRLRRR
jgi:hypothetical protein